MASFNCPDRDTRWPSFHDHHASFVSVRTLMVRMGTLPRHENMIAVLAVDEGR